MKINTGECFTVKLLKLLVALFVNQYKLPKLYIKIPFINEYI